jgi:RNA polymerase sigma-70 factor (ECF subfamily)
MKNVTENNVQDHLLVKKVLSGDTQAFAMIIKNTERLVAQIVFKMISHDEDKKDIAQDVYIKAFRNLGTFKFQSKLSTWIGQIAYNTCINHLEKKKLVLLDTFYTDNETDEELLENAGHNNHETLRNDTEESLFHNELAQVLKTETDKLPPIYKTLITLFHHEELSHTEIAEITALPEGTIKNYLFRARKMLKNNLLKNYKKEDL